MDTFSSSISSISAPTERISKKRKIALVAQLSSPFRNEEIFEPDDNNLKSGGSSEINIEIDKGALA